MRGMERHDDREIGRWRHVAFDDGDGVRRTGFITSVDRHPSGTTVDVETTDMTWKHLPADRIGTDDEPPRIPAPEPDPSAPARERLHAWLRGRASDWLAGVIGDGSIQMAVDANTPDERHLDGWIGARHRFALACETADPAAMRDALDAVRDRATRDHILEESPNPSHGGAGYHTPFSESWRLPDILDLALDLFVPRDDEPLWMGLPCMGREDGEATEGAIADPTDLTVAADGSHIPVDPDPADRPCGPSAGG